MADIIVTIIVAALILYICFYLYKQKQKGRKCMGCSMSGSCLRGCSECFKEQKHKSKQDE